MRSLDGDTTTLPPLDGDEEHQVDVEKWALNELPWLGGVPDDGGSRLGMVA